MLALLLAALAACSGCRYGDGSVSGKVTHNGNPLPGGSVQFHTSAGAFVAEVGPDGSYSLPALPPGPARVSVTCQSTRPAADATPPARGRTSKVAAARVRAEEPNKIPARFGEPTTSGLTYEVAPGFQTHNIDLR